MNWCVPLFFFFYWLRTSRGAAQVLEAYQPGDVVFVHDYHLMLVPQLLRAAVGPSMRIGWFLHVSSSVSHDAK